MRLLYLTRRRGKEEFPFSLLEQDLIGVLILMLFVPGTACYIPVCKASIVDLKVTLRSSYDMRPHDRFSCEVTLTPDSVAEYARAAGDSNPVHLLAVEGTR